MGASRLDTTTAHDLAELVLNHPLYAHTVLLQTPPIDEIFKLVKLAILLRDSGWVFTGESGIGKTDALDRVKMLIRHQFPRICMFTHDAHNQQIASIRAFFKHFLTTIGHSELKGETPDLRHRVVRMLVDDARVSGINLIVMFIDEASALGLQDFLFLKDIYNDLGRSDIQFVTILMGQSPDIEHVIEMLRTNNRHDLVGRFASKVYAVRAYDSVKDLQVIFKAIDDRQFPEGSGHHWTQLMVPNAWDAGFRLEHEATRAFDAIVNGTGKSRKIAFPARQTFLAIRYYLLDAAERDWRGKTQPDSAWSKAIAYAKLQDSLFEQARARKRSAAAKESTNDSGSTDE
ncbi:AAA family ATPase [Massilia sp. SM-13]|uniref:AAA family ATPase n=1 Tax=Pseudoduganella rhizocola TaxID=3382643 RepID=UPI0038B4AFE5